MNRKKRVSLGLLGLSVIAVPAIAEETFTLGRIEVSGGAALPADATERVDAEEMRTFERTTVAEAVDLLPGTTVGNFGARNEQILYVRGFDVRQVPVFVDGVPVYVPYDGYVDLGRFTTYDLAEVVVDKGFSSVLYGPNTLGGAVNLVTRRPTKALEGELGLGVFDGELDGGSGQQAWFNLGSRQEGWYTQVSGSYLNQDAFALPHDFDAAGTEEGGLRDNSYRRDSKVSLKLGLTPTAQSEYVLGYVNQQGDKGTPPYAGESTDVRARYWQWPYWNKESVYLITSNEFGGGAYLKTRLYYDWFENSLFSYDDATYTTQSRPYAFQSWYDDSGYGGSVEYGRPFGRHMVRMAAHLKYDQHQEHDWGEPKRQFRDRTSSLALEDTITLTDRLSAVLGVSHDQRESLEAEDYQSGVVSDFPGNDAAAWNPQAGLFYQLDKESAVRFTVARKSRFPTIKDRYSYRLGSAVPNPELEPERSTNYELGYTTLLGGATRLEAALFHSDIRDLIQQYDIDANTYQMRNVGHVTASGVELGLRSYLTDALELGGSYTYISRDSESDPDIYLTDVPRHKLFTYLQWDATALLRLTASLRYESDRYSSSDGLQRTDDFTVVDLKGAWQFAPHFTAELGVRNLGDVLYSYSEGYPQPGRTWYLNLLYRL